METTQRGSKEALSSRVAETSEVLDRSGAAHLRSGDVPA
jgi:hypothetical protein